MYYKYKMCIRLSNIIVSWTPINRFIHNIIRLLLESTLSAGTESFSITDVLKYAALVNQLFKWINYSTMNINFESQFEIII